MGKIPVVTTFEFLKKSAEIVKNPLPFHRANFEKHGDTFNLKLGFGKSLLFSRDPELANHVLQKNQKNYYKSKIQTKDLAKYVGYGLLTTNGAQWKKQRKLIQPAFHKKQLVQLLQEIQHTISDEFSSLVTDKQTDVYPVMNKLAFQVVVKSLFSNAVSGEQIDRLQYITEAAQKMLIKELRQPYKRWWYNLDGSIKKHLELTGEARLIIRDLIRQRQKETEKTTSDLLDMLLDARYETGESMSEEQLIDEILILFVAGHETTANALTFACLLLARNPEVQEKLSVAVSQIDTEATLMEQLQQSSYTEAVVNEVMRLYPPVYVIDRVCKEADTCEAMELEPDSDVLLSIYEIHRHTAYWDNPEYFIPERFMNGKVATHKAYYPFGAGPRKCIGNNFAMFEMVLALNTLIGAYGLKEDLGAIEYTPLISLKPKNALVQFYKK